MPAPYSDNMYSGEGMSDDDEQQDALSPTDGYFHASSSSSNANAGHQTDAPTGQQGQWSPNNQHRTSSQVPSVPNVLVEDPTLREQGAAAAKAREAEEERRLNSDNTPSPVSSSAVAQNPQQPYVDTQASSHISPTSPTSPRHFHRRSVEDETTNTPSAPLTPSHNSSENSPLFQQPIQHPSQQHIPPHQGDAPPAYSPPQQSPQQGYQTFAATPADAAMGVPEEQQRLLPREPESMGGPPDGSKSNSFWQRIKPSGANLRKKLKTVLGVLVILSIVFVLFSSFTLRPTHDHPEIIGKEPVKSPKMDDGKLEWRPVTSCLNTPQKLRKSTFNAEFRSEKNITIIQTLERNDRGSSGWSPHVSGDVRLRPTVDSSPGRIDLEILRNDEELEVEVEFDENRQQLKITVPRKVEWHQPVQAPCFQIRVTVWVPSGAILNNLVVDTVQLDVLVDSGLVVGPQGGTFLKTVTGDILTPTKSHKGDDGDKVPYTIESREVVVRTVSGDVKGWFPLYDLLEVETASGDIFLDVAPKASHPKKPTSAVLKVVSVSGDVKVQEPLDAALKAEKPDKEFPPRDYIVKISTASGNIKTDVAVSSETSLHSVSGDLILRLWPVLDSRLLTSYYRGPTLSTDTKSGDTTLELLEPLWTSIDTPGSESDAPTWPGTTEPLFPVPGQDGDKDVDWSPADDNDPYLIIHPHEQNHDESEPARGDSDAHRLSANDTPALGCLKSDHQSISGDIVLKYPSTWEGQLEVSTLSGSQKVRGEGLSVNRSGGFQRTIRGRKGQGQSEMNIQTMSGDENILIGKEVGK